MQQIRTKDVEKIKEIIVRILKRDGVVLEKPKVFTLFVTVDPAKDLSPVYKG